jgi:hypothetical protein
MEKRAERELSYQIDVRFHKVKDLFPAILLIREMRLESVEWCLVSLENVVWWSIFILS